MVKTRNRGLTLSSSRIGLDAESALRRPDFRRFNDHFKRLGCIETDGACRQAIKINGIGKLHLFAAIAARAGEIMIACRCRGLGLGHKAGGNIGLDPLRALFERASGEDAHRKAVQNGCHCVQRRARVANILFP
jgi:hypothetical protein